MDRVQSRINFEFSPKYLVNPASASKAFGQVNRSNVLKLFNEKCKDQNQRNEKHFLEEVFAAYIPYMKERSKELNREMLFVYHKLISFEGSVASTEYKALVRDWNEMEAEWELIFQSHEYATNLAKVLFGGRSHLLKILELLRNSVVAHPTTDERIMVGLYRAHGTARWTLDREPDSQETRRKYRLLFTAPTQKDFLRGWRTSVASAKAKPVHSLRDLEPQQSLLATICFSCFK